MCSSDLKGRVTGRGPDIDVADIDPDGSAVSGRGDASTPAAMRSGVEAAPSKRSSDAPEIGLRWCRCVRSSELVRHRGRSWFR